MRSGLSGLLLASAAAVFATDAAPPPPEPHQDWHPLGPDFAGYENNIEPPSYAKWEKSSGIRVLRELAEMRDQSASHLNAPIPKDAPAEDHTLRVALGFNVCVDRVARLAAVMGAAAGGSLATASEESLRSASTASRTSESATVGSLEELAVLVEEHVKDGAAAERVMGPDSGFAELVAAAGAEKGKFQDRLGGNAALMAAQMSRMGVKVMLGGRVGPTTARLLRGFANIQTMQPRLDDGPAEDDTHLILEYGQGETWRGASSPRANRFIVTQDSGLADATALSDLASTVSDGSFEADGFVVAGLHMLEQLPEARWRRALDDVAARARALPAGVAVHVELASVASSAFMEALLQRVVSSADSLGLNEQELADAFEASGGLYADDAAGAPSDPDLRRRSDLTGGRDAASGRHSMPSVPACLAAVRHLIHRFRSLSRVHLHTLGFHVIAETDSDAPRREGFHHRWQHAGGAVATGATVAAEAACAAPSRTMTREHVRLRVNRTIRVADRRLRAALAASDVPLPTDAAEANPDLPPHLTINMAADRIWRSAVQPPVTLGDGGDTVAFVEWPKDPQAATEVAGRPLPTLPEPPADARDAPPGGIPIPDSMVDGPPDGMDAHHWVHFAIAPVPVCREPRSTVGLGDAVSASGLAAHLGTSHRRRELSEFEKHEEKIRRRQAEHDRLPEHERAPPGGEHGFAEGQNADHDEL